MKISRRIIQRVAINMMDNLPALCAGYLSVLPVSAIALGSVPQSEIALLLSRTMPVSSLRRCVGRDSGRDFTRRPDHFVAAPVVFARGQAAHLGFIRIERVAVVPPHLVMPPAHFAGDCRSLAIRTGSANDLAAPSVVGRSMLLLPLIVHQAKTVGGVFPFTSGDVALSHAANDNSFLIVCIDKALGNSMAVPCMAWIGDRIAAVEALAQQAEAA